jgi:O-antigen ligase
MMWVVMFSVYLSLSTVLINRYRFNTELFCISLVAGVTGIIGLLEYAGQTLLGWNVSMQFWGSIDDVILTALPIDLLPAPDVIRSASTFNNPNIFAEYLVMVIPFMAYFSFSGHRTKAQLVCRFSLLAAGIGAACSFSRGAYLALLLVGLIFCIANIRKIKTIILSLASVLLLIPQSVQTRLFSITTTDVSINTRYNIWAYGIQAFWKNPLTGVGAGVSNSWQILLQEGINAPHMHNIALQLLIEGGLMALLLMVLVGLTMFRTALTMLNSNDSRSIGVAFIAFVAAFCMDGMVDFPLLTPKLVGVFLMVIALGDCASKLYLGIELEPLRSVVPVMRWGTRSKKAPAYIHKS